MLSTYFDLSQFLIGGPGVTDTAIIGSTGSIRGGTVIGRIASTNKIIACVSTATDGSQVPIGCMLATMTTTDGDTIPFLRAGEVDGGLLTFSNGTDTLATNVVITADAGTAILGTMGDTLAGKGIYVRNVANLTQVPS